MKKGVLDARYISEKDRELLERYVEERNMSDGTFKGYWSAFKHYTEFHKMSLTELLREAREEQKKGVNPNETKLRQRLLDYRRHLMETYDAQSTIKAYESKVETFYKHWAIYLPQLPQAKIGKGYIAGWGDLPTLNHMRKAIEYMPKLRTYILFAMSSGTAKAECLSITVDMFLRGLEEYTDIDRKPRQILEELECRRDIVPSIYLRRIKTDKWYTTFCSPEASLGIIEELLLRDKIRREDKLFPHSSSSVVTMFQKINDHFQWGWVGKYRLFRSHTLRKFNASNIGLPAEDVDALQGRSRNAVHETYIKRNPLELKKKYMGAMHRVMCYPENYAVCQEGVQSQSMSSFGTPKQQQSPQVGDNFGVVQGEQNNQSLTNNAPQIYMEIGKLQQRIERLEKELRNLKEDEDDEEI